MKHIYTSVDIGSDSIKVVTCELFKNKLNLLAASSVKSQGIKKGLITDVDAASASLRAAFDEVEQMLGIKITKVIASIPSYFAEFNVVKGNTIVSNPEHIVSTEDVLTVMQKAIATNKTSSADVVALLPIDFKVDDQDNLRDPKGLRGQHLEARAVVATTPRKNIQSVASLIASVGVEVIDVSLNGIGDVYSFRNKEIDAGIGAIINIGAEITSVSLYNKGILVKNNIIQGGGRDIDNDIAYIYKLDRKVAKQLKEKFALAHKMYAQSNDIIDLVNNVGENIRINQYEISEIAMMRLEEMLILAKKEIKNLTNRQIDYIIITGGTSNMANFSYIAEEIFGKGVVIGNVKLIGVRNNKYASAIGNIVYFISKLKLKGTDYTMVSRNDIEELSSTRKNLIDGNESMVGKVFGFFFNE